MKVNPRRQTFKPKRHNVKKVIGIIIVILLLVVGATYAHSHKAKAPGAKSQSGSTSTQAAAKPNVCASNTLTNFVLVSISQQHMWACAATTQVYDNAVITGMELYPADLTPTGTYKVYAKATDQTLAGHDNTGSWSDQVSYWMPFLDNQYGTYGFHDATWRSPNDFGHVNINAPYTAAKAGSHGCVEMPLAAAKWLYNWAPVGTTVTVET